MSENPVGPNVHVDDADPLADIHNTQRIHAIVVRGQFIDSAGRERLLLGARQAARSF